MNQLGNLVNLVCRVVRMPVEFVQNLLSPEDPAERQRAAAIAAERRAQADAAFEAQRVEEELRRARARARKAAEATRVLEREAEAAKTTRSPR